MTYLNFEMRFIRTFFPFLKAGASSRASLNLTWKLYLSDFSILTFSSNFQFWLLNERFILVKLFNFVRLVIFDQHCSIFTSFVFCPILFEFLQLCSILSNLSIFWFLWHFRANRLKLFLSLIQNKFALDNFT